MTGEMKEEEYRSPVAFVLPELRMFLKGCAMVSPPCGPPACLCVVSIAAGSGQYGHQQLLEAVSTASGQCSRETEFFIYIILMKFEFENVLDSVVTSLVKYVWNSVGSVNLPFQL